MLQKRRDQIFDALAVMHPIEVRDLKNVLELIASRESTPGGDFLTIRSPKKAVLLCLAEFGRFATKAEVIQRLIDGGFAVDPVRGKWLLNDVINHLVTDGVLTTNGVGEKLESEIGLPVA